MLESKIPLPVEAEEVLVEAEIKAHTGILLSVDRKVVGVIAISDPLKLGAREVISLLKSMNIMSIMITGDNWGTANSIAKVVGIETVVTEAKPDQKAESVNELQGSGYNYDLTTLTPSKAYTVDLLRVLTAGIINFSFFSNSFSLDLRDMLIHGSICYSQ
ncbi:hypothetical protein GIB67_002856 [Kingdonia uniflora]|uniref:Uncharacterized protein n=1 Tax=Kingdonia uniflora TaxID=39325 RepID=A0A7J7M5M2_9MAGN|nr:hypothetical protein GIB67_002856 [Kingdonia uniflora]